MLDFMWSLSSWVVVRIISWCLNTYASPHTWYVQRMTTSISDVGIVSKQWWHVFMRSVVWDTRFSRAMPLRCWWFRTDATTLQRGNTIATDACLRRQTTDHIAQKDRHSPGSHVAQHICHVSEDGHHYGASHGQMTILCSDAIKTLHRHAADAVLEATSLPFAVCSPLTPCTMYWSTSTVVVTFRQNYLLASTVCQIRPP